MVKSYLFNTAFFENTVLTGLKILRLPSNSLFTREVVFRLVVDEEYQRIS